MNKKLKSSAYKYTEFSSPVKLSGILEKIWVFESFVNSEDEPHFQLIPDYTTSIIAILPLKANKLQLFLTGPNTHNIAFRTYTSQITAGFRFYPGIYPEIFDLKPIDTINRKVSIEKYISRDDLTALTAKILHSKITRSIVSVLTELFYPYFQNSGTVNDEINDVINKIISFDGVIKLEDIYSEISISQRQFQRNFTKRTGLLPKEFCRIVRFHKVTRKLVKNNFRHFDTLVESGYYDQSHYYREFKEFLGMLPGKFESRQKKIQYSELLK